RAPLSSSLFPYTTLFRSGGVEVQAAADVGVGKPYRREPGGPGRIVGQVRERVVVNERQAAQRLRSLRHPVRREEARAAHRHDRRSEEHTSELQSLTNLVC